MSLVLHTDVKDMEFNEEYIAIKMGDLAAKKIRGQLSEDEDNEFNYLLQKYPEYLQTYSDLVSEQKKVQNSSIKHYDSEAALDRILKRQVLKLKRKREKIWWVAAAIFVLISMGSYWMLWNNNIPKHDNIHSAYGDEVIAGMDNPKIRLSDGTLLELDKTHSGVKVLPNEIVYEDGKHITSGINLLNLTLITPKGRQYTLTLPDGTKAVMNAGSSLTYPSDFKGHERVVELEGEAYFEVTHDPDHPFRVKSSQQQVVVLGTKFNVSVYNLETPLTTLIDGKVRLVAHNAKDVILKPGQQSELKNNTFKIQRVTSEDYVAWMNNQFVFNNTSLNEVFNSLQRWYDITFDYPQELSNERIYAEITRERKLSEVLKIMEEITNLKFTVKGRRVAVKK